MLSMFKKNGSNNLIMLSMYYDFKEIKYRISVLLCDSCLKNRLLDCKVERVPGTHQSSRYRSNWKNFDSLSYLGLLVI